MRGYNMLRNQNRAVESESWPRSEVFCVYTASFCASRVNPHITPIILTNIKHVYGAMQLLQIHGTNSRPGRFFPELRPSSGHNPPQGIAGTRRSWGRCGRTRCRSGDVWSSGGDELASGVAGDTSSGKLPLKCCWDGHLLESIWNIF